MGTLPVKVLNRKLVLVGHTVQVQQSDKHLKVTMKPAHIGHEQQLYYLHLL